MKKKIWDLYAPIYKQAMKADQKIYTFMYERIPQKIKEMEVLEIATGPGLLARHVAPAAKRMVATDYSDGMIAEAKKGECPGNLTFEVADAAELPYEDKSFDAVLISNALHIVPDPEKVLTEIDRVLRPGGRAFPIPAEHDLKAVLQRMEQEFKTFPDRFWTARQVDDERLLPDAGSCPGQHGR